MAASLPPAAVTRAAVTLAAVCAAACASESVQSAAGTGADGGPAAAPPDASGCLTGPESAQRHGTPCLCCHSDEFGVAGSVGLTGPPVARIVVTGADGDVADMYVNSFGNFFRHFPMETPVSAVAYGPRGRPVAMRELAPTADCNVCHGEKGAAGPIFGP